MRLLNSCLLLVAIACAPLLFSQNSLHGIDVTDLDPKADPCNDFFQFSNGTWRANNPIPASMTRWSKRWAAGETNKDSLKEIADQAAKEKNLAPGSTNQIVGDYYGACMDETRVNARGIAPVKPLLAEIDTSKNMSELQRAMADLHDIGVTVPFNLASSQDPHRPTLVLADIAASGYALPDRDYYLKADARFKEAREKYLQHMINMFKLTGSNSKQAADAAATVMTMETKLAEAALDNVTLRDPSATDHNTSFAQLQTMVPHFDWAMYFEHKHLAKDVDLNVDQPKYMQAIELLLQQTPLVDWKIYLKWQLLNSVASSLSEPLVEEDFAFNGKYLTGSERDETTMEALRGVDRPVFGRSAGTGICEKVFPTRGQSTHAGNGAKSVDRHARRHPVPRLDERRY